VIFDGDDTLWRAQPIFKAVLRSFYDQLVQQGFALSEATSLFLSINRDLLQKMRFARDRLSLAMVSTYETLCSRAGVDVKHSVLRGLVDLAEEVYARSPEPMEGAYRVLATLQHEYELYFYSGGIAETQIRRLAQSGLLDFFQERVFVLGIKDSEALNGILSRAKLRPETSWMVGNSPKFDLLPALHTGLKGIWMCTGVWREEIEDIGLVPVHAAFSLDEVASILIEGTGFGKSIYMPSSLAAREFRSWLLGLVEQELWGIGVSPRDDINPFLSVGAKVIWIPTMFGPTDIEPLRGPVFVAFSEHGAQTIMDARIGSTSLPSKAVWRLRQVGANERGVLVVD